jgi:transmembrane sensor
MEEQKLTDLIGKFLAGKANDIEKKQLNDWYSGQIEKEAIWAGDSDREESKVEARMLRQIKDHVNSTRPNISFFDKRFILRVAATFAGLLFCAGGYFYATRQKEKSVAASISGPVKVSENKYLTLPDSSIVVLHGRSKITYSFNGKERQLSLVGEAYFDIKHNTQKPFIIHTGSVITTVLGTAFNIKAYPGQSITVSVTRGKVSVVAENRKVVAVLLPNQQVIYNDAAKSTRLQHVKTQEVISWAKSDMPLDDIPFKEVAELLSRRYGIEMKFKNSDIEKCLIHGRFDGTESIKQVLDALTQTIGATYTLDKHVVVIDGNSCQ